MNFEEAFTLEEATKTNILISGSNASGKTLLACGLSSILHRLGQVIVFDNSGVGKKVSDLPFVSKIYRHNGRLLYGQFSTESGIYDTSLLRRSEAQKIVELETAKIWEERAVRPFNNPMWLVFEESEAYLRNIRGSASENVFRIIHQGRNQQVRAILITTDLALLDASVIRLCQVRFHGSLGIEENAKRKFRAYYGKDYTRIATEGLEVGDFIRLRKKHLDLVSVPEFKRKKAPRLFFPKPETEPEKPRVTFWQALKSLF